jgi:subtilisin family serine protease
MTKRLIIFFLLFFMPSIVYVASAGEDYVTDELIIKLKSDADPSLVESNVHTRGAVIRKSISNLNMMLVQVAPGDSINDVQQSLETDPNVEYVEKNYILYTSVTPNDPLFGLQTYLNVIDAPQAWNIQKGDSNVVIAVLDTGVENTHEDIAGKLLAGCNVLGNSTETSCGSDVDDNNGHGTGVAGTAAANTNNSRGVAGICWNCSILPVKVLDDSGSGTVMDAAEGIMFARNYALSNPAKRVVINMSLGRDCQSSGVTQTEQDAINAAWSAGVLVVASAGNSGNSDLQCPAAADHVIAVSATTNSDTKASFSSFGSFVDLAAPGVGIVNAYGTSNAPGSSYAYWSGTSFSAPIVSGVAGLVWSADKTLTNAEVDQILRDTAENIGSSFYFGDGRVNADFAVTLASGSNPAPTPPPGPAPTPTPPPSSPGSFSLTGFNPGTAGARNTLTVTGAPARSTVGFYYSTVSGRTTISRGVCNGQSLDLKRAALIGTVRADSSGTATLSANLSSSLGGRTLYLQSTAETSTSCQVTGLVSQTIKPRSSSGSGGGSGGGGGRRPSRRR